MKTTRKASVFRAFAIYSLDTTAAIIGWLYGFGMSVHNWYVLIGILIGWRFLFHIIQMAFIYDDAMKYAMRSGAAEDQDPWTGLIHDYLKAFEQIDMVTARELLTDCLHCSRYQCGQNSADTIRIAKIMRDLGWKKMRSMSGAREYFYARPQDPVAAAANASADRDVQS